MPVQQTIVCTIPWYQCCRHLAVIDLNASIAGTFLDAWPAGTFLDVWPAGTFLDAWPAGAGGLALGTGAGLGLGYLAFGWRYCTGLPSTGFHSTALHSSVLHSTELHCTILCLYLDKTTRVQENTSMTSRELMGANVSIFLCSPTLVKVQTISNL